jgi:aspartyl-tRNA(Asn)/glutamyl-tRNA(Gln) amidotransferase subunit C
LNEVDTEGVAPMASTEAVKLPMREDVVTEGGDPAVVLGNAPKSERGFYVVPKVVE